MSEQTKRKSAQGSEVATHESYGLLGISRTMNGRGETLFGSSIKHASTVRLTISRGEHHRSKHHYDTYMDAEQLIEVEMSLSQFAEAIFSFNHGCGVPCTIRRFNNARVSDPPFESKRDQLEREHSELLNQMTQRIKELEVLAKSLLDQKNPLKKDEREKLKEAIFEMCRIPRDHLPFFGKMVNEQLDRTTHEAKLEVEGFLQSRLHEMGMDALSKEMPPLLEEGPEDKE